MRNTNVKPECDPIRTDRGYFRKNRSETALSASNGIGLKQRIARFLLDLDARIDSGLFHAGRWGRELYERYSTWMDGWHVGGWKRWVLNAAPPTLFVMAMASVLVMIKGSIGWY